MKKYAILFFLFFLLYSKIIFSQDKIIDWSKINFVDTIGKKQGLWIEYSVSSISMHDPIVSIYDPKINVYSIGTFVDNNKVGKWYYYENQRLNREDWYKNDSMCYSVNYYINNQIQSQGWYNLKVVSQIKRISEDGQKELPYYGSIKINNWMYYCLDGSKTKEEDLDEIEYEKYNFSINDNNRTSFDLKYLNTK